MISLGIDIGGTGCKCVAFSSDGQQLALAYREYPLPAGSVDLPAEMLTQAVFAVIAECCDRLEDRSAIAVITVSSFGESFVPIDAEGKPLTDILMYFGNAESEEFDRLVSRVGKERFMRIAKILPDASYSLAKMLYTQQKAARPVFQYLFVASFICYRLTGLARADVSLACRSLLYDVEGGCWSKTLAELCDIDLQTLPQVLPTGGKVGCLLPEVAQKLGMGKDVQVVIGSHDQIVNALGAGVQHVGDAVDTSGTCECLTPLYGKIPQDPSFQENNFACVPYLNSGGYVTYAYNISAGSVVRWYRDALAGSLEQQARDMQVSVYDLMNRQCPAEPTNLLVLPFLQGMGGTPDVDPGATGLIAGLTTQTRLPNIYRAILEGITFEMRYNQEKLAENGVQIQRLYACGGGAKSQVWLQIKADILGCPIIPVQAEQTGAMSSAILGIAAVTGEDPFRVGQRFWRYDQPLLPREREREIYNEKYRLYKTLRELYMTERKKNKE